jgi:transcriptional regulator with XRE-family HTH domain
MTAQSSSCEKIKQSPTTDSEELHHPKSAKIGKFFHERRLAAGLSLETVAIELSLEVSADLQAYENGQKAIPLDEIFALTNILNIPPDDVIDLIHGLKGRS